MLKQRLLAALVLLPLVLLAVFRLPDIGFQLFVAAVVLVSAWEWSRLAQLTSPVLQGVFIAIVGLLMLAVACSYGVSLGSPILLAAVIAWFAFTVWVAVYPKGLPTGEPRKLLGAVVGIVILVPFWLAASAIQNLDNTGGWWLLIMLFLIWAADTGAYFFGRAFGKTKLAPRVSPGKTWEGVAGAMVGATFIVVVAWLWAPLPAIREHTLMFLLIALVTVGLSIVGDLTESMFKRHSGIKDSSQLIPGHGGLFDRIDSLTAAAPVYAFGLACLLGA